MDTSCGRLQESFCTLKRRRSFLSPLGDQRTRRLSRHPATAATTAAPAAPKKYVPPGARGASVGVATSGGTSLAALAAAVEGGGSAAMRTGPVLGAEPEEGSSSRNAAKNKAKREAAKKKKEAEAAGALAPAIVLSAAKAESASAASSSEETADKLLKKVRNVEKKLRQIAELKELQTGGKPLEKNQLDKVANEEAVRKELEVLQLAHKKAEEKEQAAAKEGMWR